ncbi:hypothetical protein CDD83_5618 [Cordyceps sp. RAO-2017]|nr:hypothetical protein CDD83_5618 [Cordyceps sp. RAO-2017]
MWKALLLAALPLLAGYLHTKIHHKRFQQYAGFPQLPTSFILGNLKLLGEYIKHGPADRYPDMMLPEMHQDLARPPLILVDLQPINRPLVLIANHEIAEQVS